MSFLEIKVEPTYENAKSVIEGFLIASKAVTHVA